MITVAHKLTFADGSAVTATMTAESPQGSYQVVYTGAVDRLPRRLDKCDPFDLRALFINLARELQAEHASTESGEFDFLAE